MKTMWKLIAAALLLTAATLGAAEQAAQPKHPSEETDPVKAEKQGWVPAVPPNKYWSTYLIMPWQLSIRAGGTDVLVDQAEYRRVGLRAFHIDHGNSGANLKQRRFAVENNWPFYLGHACGKGILHLHKSTRNRLRKKEKASRAMLKRPYCLAAPAVMRKLKGILKPRVEAMKGAPVVGYAFDDEVSLGSFNSPLELDISPASIAAYRKWLKKEYGGDLAALNKEYGTSFPSFEAVSPVGFERARRGMNAKSLGRINLSRWIDWRSYMDTQLAECLRELVKYSNKLDPTTPAGFVGAQQPSAWAGYDYAKLRKVVQWIEAYDIGGTNEILRSFWPQTRPHVQTWFSGHAGVKANSWALWFYMCHGNRAAIQWPAGMFRSVNGKRKISPVMEGLAPTFKEIQGKLSTKIINGRFLNDPIAIYYSQPSVILNWAMDSHVHGKTWPSRSSSMDNAHSTSGNTRVAWLKTLEDLGFQGKFVAAEDVADGILTREKYKVLILPRILCLSDREAAAIRAFVEAGGTVIADQVCGLFDGRGKARGGQGVLDNLFGVKHDLTKGLFAGTCLTEVNCEKGYDGISPFNLEHGCSMLRGRDFKDLRALAKKILAAGKANASTPARRVWEVLGENGRKTVENFMMWDSKKPANGKEQREKRRATWHFKVAVNGLLGKRDFYSAKYFGGIKPPAAAEKLLKRDRNDLWKREVERLNRLLLEASFPTMFTSVALEPFAGHDAGMAVCERGLSTSSGKALKTDEKTGAAVVVRRKNAVYLNLSPICYLLERDKVDGAKWRKLVKQLLTAAGLKPRCTVERNGKPVEQGIELLYWDNNGVVTLCVVANFLHKATISSFKVDLGGMETATLKLAFSKAVKELKNERTGEKLGDKKTFSFSFKPWEAGVFTYKQ